MIHPPTHEGTPEEITAFLERQPENHRFRITDISEDVETTSDENMPLLDAKTIAAIAFLDARIAEGNSASPETRRQAEAELEEFKQGMNANRVASGEGCVYP